MSKEQGNISFDELSSMAEETTSSLTRDNRRRKISQVDPSSPVETPLNESRMSRLLAEALADALAPIHTRLDEIQEGQAISSEEASHFHSNITKLTNDNKTFQARISSLEKENQSLKMKLTSIESQSR